MSQKQFKKFRDTLTRQQFNSVKFLTIKVEEYKESDPELSKRILGRVRNLQVLINKKALENKETLLIKNNTEISEPKDKGFVENLSINIVNKGASDTTNQKITSSFLAKMMAIINIKVSPFILLVVLPTLLFSFYQIFWATERFESQAKVLVEQPDSTTTMDSGMAFLSGLGAGGGSSDAELVKTYIYSTDMINYLNKELDLRSHYAQSNIDYFSRVHDSDSREDLYKFYQNHIQVVIEEKSRVITIKSQGFDSIYAQRLSNSIVNRAEWFINSIGHQLANAQLGFIQGEHKLIEQRLAEAQKQLLLFQQKYNLLDPTAEGAAMQQIAYTLEGQIAVKQTEIKTMKAIMSSNAPQVKSLENELVALKAQLLTERNKLSKSGQEKISVSEVLSKFTDYKIKMELALQAYTSSQVSLEKSRIQAYRQIKYLVVVDASTLSEDSKYPDVTYNVALFLLIFSMFFGIGKIIITTINELK